MFSKELLKSIPLPSLLLDVDALERNIKKIAAQANGKKIRIATKSIRSVKVLEKILKSDPTFQGLMCFTPKEACFLAEKGFDDILLGYPCTDEEALQEIARWNEKGKQIVCMVDTEEQITLLENVAKKYGGFFYVCLDIDMSTTYGPLHFGVRRSPIQQKEGALKLASHIRHAKNVTLIGIMGYEAQIAGVGDRMPAQGAKNRLVSYLKKRSLPTIEKRRKEIVEALQNEGFSLDIVNGGGTGSLHLTSKETVVTEVTVGSGFYSPLLFDYYRDFQYEPSLYFALPIVRKPTDDIYTCLGGGYVASGPPGKDKIPQPVFPEGGKLLSLEAAGEVQTPVQLKNVELQIGDAIVFRAAKAGEICERFNEIICIRNNEIVDHVLTYRGEGGAFL